MTEQPEPKPAQQIAAEIGRRVAVGLDIFRAALDRLSGGSGQRLSRDR